MDHPVQECRKEQGCKWQVNKAWTEEWWIKAILNKPTLWLIDQCPRSQQVPLLSRTIRALCTVHKGKSNTRRTNMICTTWLQRISDPRALRVGEVSTTPPNSEGWLRYLGACSASRNEKWQTWILTSSRVSSDLSRRVSYPTSPMQTCRISPYQEPMGQCGWSTQM